MKSLPLPLMRLAGFLLMGLAALVALGFHQAADHYGGFPQPTLRDVALPVGELVFQAMYLAYGIPFVLLMGLGLWWTRLTRDASKHLARFGRHPRAPTLLALVIVAGSLAVRFFVLQREVITDDEETYLFIARTLLRGNLVNPLPADAAFFANQYVVVNAQGWFGKYPIGHGLVLALGLMTGTLDGVVCLLGGVTAALTYQVGRRTVGPRRALVGLVLLALSPHFVWTQATLLSQTTCSFGMVASTAAWLAWQHSRRASWLGASGLAMALSIAARPMPGLLFAASLGAATLWAWKARRASLHQVALFAATAGLGVLLVAVTNLAQSGSMLRSGYHEVHGSLGVMVRERGATGLSVFGGLWRENFWLLGWPLSLLPLLGARVRRGAWLLWGPVVAELMYRITVPKTVVTTTGPTYLMEMVPLLCLLASDGLARAGVMGRRLLGKPGATSAFVLASTSAAFVFFLPIQVRAVDEGAQARQRVWTLLKKEGVTRAVIFTSNIVNPREGKSWAFFPPTPSPTLDDDLLFVRWPFGAADPLRTALEFAQRRFPDRPAFVYGQGERPELLPLVVPAAAP